LTGILTSGGSFKELATENSAGELVDILVPGFSHAPPFLAELNVRLFALGSADLRELAIVFGNRHKSYEGLLNGFFVGFLAVGR
jgi:hypothetical protein